MQRQKKQLKTVVVVESNVTNALIAEDSLLSRQLSGATKNKIWVWTVVNHWKPGILLWTVGDAFGVRGA